MALDRDERRELAADEPIGTSHARLARLDDLDDYELADDEPDPRGWDVRTTDGRTIGKVDGLIAEPNIMQVRYLEVDLDRDTFGLQEERHVLVPIGRARLDDDRDVVTLNVGSNDMLGQLPPYRGGPIERDYEVLVVTGLGGQTSGSDFYGNSDYFDDRRFYGNRWRPNR